MKNKHLTEVERYQLERFLKEKRTVKEIAAILDKSERTIYYEKKRGQVEQLDGHSWKKYKTYKADYAQTDYKTKLRRERELKVDNNIEYIRFVSDCVRKNHCSFYAARMFWKRQGKINPVCERTLYNYYAMGLFLNLKPGHLPYHKPKRKKDFSERQAAKHSVDKRSIEKRPASVLLRDSFGHWEMDSVVSGKQKGTSVLLVLTERQTRTEIVLKIPDKKSASVVAALDSLEQAMGSQQFKNTFRTITVDNGSEFMDMSGMEKNERTTLYYCHPYCSGERGSNENQNRLIRRWVPKGSSIDSMSDREVKNIMEWMNNYPRRMFGGLSSLECFEVVNTQKINLYHSH